MSHGTRAKLEVGKRIHSPPSIAVGAVFDCRIHVILRTCREIIGLYNMSFINQIEWNDESGEVMIGTIPHIKVACYSDDDADDYQWVVIQMMMLMIMMGRG